MGLTIRHATVEDAADIARVHVGTWRAAYRGLIPDDALAAMTPEQRRPMWDRLLAARDRVPGVVVAEMDGILIGFTSFGPTSAAEDADAAFELFTIYVDPAAQGRGAGTGLLLAAEAAMRGAGAEEAVLWVLDGNEQAQRFYRKHGWTPTGTQKTETLFGIDVRELLYTRDLEASRPPGDPISPS